MSRSGDASPGPEFKGVADIYTQILGPGVTGSWEDPGSGFTQGPVKPGHGQEVASELARGAEHSHAPMRPFLLEALPNNFRRIQ
jgi:hypothetical protein